MVSPGHVCGTTTTYTTGRLGGTRGSGMVSSAAEVL